MSFLKAITGAEIFDGFSRHQHSSLLIENGRVKGIVPEHDAPPVAEQIFLDGGMIIPGFIDLQVNGGGGVLLNESPGAEAIETICQTHFQFGTTALLPTLITDKPEISRLAVDAGIEAKKRKIPGFLGLHLEGPHLSLEKKGAHVADFITSMNNEDLLFLQAAKGGLDILLVTVAPESVSCSQIKELSRAGIVLSLGHSNASFKEASMAAQSGARSVTHLFNAMSPLTNREPGIVGAALEIDALYAGLIADGFHVDPAAISIALRAKSGPGKIYLVTDAMSTIGTDLTEFALNGRTIRRSNGRLTLEDGTLAGADLDMISAVRYMAESVGTGWEEAIRMASLYPAQCLGIEASYGHLQAGAIANFSHVNTVLDIQRVWLEGVTAFVRRTELPQPA